MATVAPYPGLPTLYLAHNAIELQKTGDWYRNFEYDIERERGLDFTEDLFNHFILRFDLLSNRQASIIASIERRDVAKSEPVSSSRDQTPPDCGAGLSPQRRVCPGPDGCELTSTSSLGASRRPSSPAITGSVIGDATP